MKPRCVLVAAALLTYGALPFPSAARAGATAPARAPERLSDTGLFAGPGTTAIDPRHRPYTPQYPLWTDGAAKARWIYLPPGAEIDVSDVDAWKFPVGTKLWKQFAFGGRKVETRLIWRAGEDEWIYATYVWNDAQTDALLAPAEGVPDVVEVAPGKRHSIPAVTDCAACHADSRRVLGFNALQLSDDRDPLAPHSEPLEPSMVTLRALIDERRLSPLRRDLVDRPPRIAAASPRERAALGYLAGNCGHCHNANGPLRGLGLNLDAAPYGGGSGRAPAITTARDVPGNFLVPGVAPDRSFRIASGAPDRSAIIHRMQSRRPSSQMPPLGSVVPDPVALSLVEQWIREDLAPHQ